MKNLISKDEYLLACGVYIERNPLRARMVRSPREYPHSSYKYYCWSRKDDIVDEDPCYRALGKDLKDRQSVYQNLLIDKQKNITGRIFDQLFLGPEAFVHHMEQKFNLKNIRLIRGRPKKANK